MTIIYKHEASENDLYDTLRIVVERLYDGSTDITTIVGEYGNPAAFARHNLSIAQSDKLGAALCKDIIDNYKGHATNLRDKIADLENTDRDTRYDNTRLQQELGDCRKAFTNLVDERNEYKRTLHSERVDHVAEKRVINQFHNDIHRSNNSAIKELEDGIDELQAVNDIHRRHGEIYRDKISRLRDTCSSEATSTDSPAPSYGVRSLNFGRLIKGYHGMLSRHGKTIVITLPFEQEIVAINAVEYITGHDEHTDHNINEGN